MATLQELQEALIGADRVGNAADARVLADEIARMQAASAFPPVQSFETAAAPSPPTAPAPVGESWQPPPLAPPPERPAETPLSDMSAPVGELPSMMQSPPTGGGIAPGRAAKLGGQAILSGLTSAAMFPLDVPAYAQAGLDWGADKVAGKFGLPSRAELERQGVAPPRLGIPSDRVKQGASWIGKQLGYEEATPETTGEKAFSNVLQLGSEAAGGATALSRLAARRAAELAKPGTLPIWSDKFVRPYAEQPLKTIVGDTAGGMAAGGALTGSQQLPESIRETGGGAVGFGADLLAMLTGGVSGGTLANMVMKTPTRMGELARASQKASDISVDPVTGMGTANRDADEAAKFIQSITSGAPRDVAAQMAERVQSFKDQGLPVPTSGLLVDDLGLAGLEKRQRTRAGPGTTQLDPDLPREVREQFSFGDRDKAQRQAAADQVQSVQQPGVDQTVFQSRAAERAQMELDARQRAVDRPTGQAQSVQRPREAAARDLDTNVGQTPGASSDIFDVYQNTRTIERDRSQALYSRPEFTEHVFEAGPVQEAAAEIRARATGAAPVTPRAEAIIQRIETAAETGQLSGRELAILNKDIESEIKLSLRDGQDFQQLKALKDSIAQTVTQLPRAHPAREAIDIARANTANVIAPNFREGAGGALDQRLKTSPGQVQPETAGASFLNRGRDTEQLMRIAELRGNTAEVAASARAIVLDQLAGAGVVKNGVIDADKLTQWRNKRANVIEQIPGLNDEIGGMIADARRGAGKASQYTDEIAAAEARLTQTQKDIQTGPVGKIADKTPQEAVASIMGGPNAPKTMAELRVKMGNNPDANRSLKAAVADHFAERVKQIDTSLDDAAHGVSLQKLVKDFNKHRETLVAAGFTPEEMQALQRAQTALLPLTKRNVQATVGSTTAESTEAAMRPLELALKGYYGVLKGGGVFRTMKVALKTLKGDNTSAIEQLMTRAMFDPELAQVLLTRDVKKAGTPAWNAELQKVLRRNEAIKDVVREDEE